MYLYLEILHLIQPVCPLFLAPKHMHPINPTPVTFFLFKKQKTKKKDTFFFQDAFDQPCMKECRCSQQQNKYGSRDKNNPAPVQTINFDSFNF